MYYKFIDNTTTFASINPHLASDFAWDRDVCEFFDTISYLGGNRTWNFVRGPGFVGTGRGGAKEFRTFSDFNLCGPSTNSSKRFHAGYTTDSGVIKPHLLSLYSFAFNSAADLPALISTNKVEVILVCEAIDGTALKPGLEFDLRQKKVVGLVNPLEPRMFTENTIPESKEIKDKLITSAEVIYATTLDNGASIPVGVWYRPKSVSGEEMLQSIQKSAKTIQTCERCLKQQTATNHIVSFETSQCLSSCDECLELKSVCPNCKEKDHTSHIPSLRACNTCLDEGFKCNKFLVMVVVTDCEECNKKALLTLNSNAEDETLPAELSLIVALPDVVHLGKSLKCSWANWYIELEGAKSNLVLIRTLRDCGSPDIRRKLRKLLTLDCVRNKDRMAVEPIVRLTRSAVLDVLKEVTFVVHTVVPEKYRFWKSNQGGQSSLCKKPIAVKRGSQGKILALDYNFISHESRLVELRLHQPVDVEVLEGTFKDARDFCFSNGVVFVAERASSSIRFIDIEGKVTVKPGSLKSRADLLSQLTRFGLPLDGTVPVLRNRLTVHLQSIAAEIGNPKCVQVNPPLEKPSSICVASEDILLCADDTKRDIIQVSLNYNGVGIDGTGIKLVNYPTGITSVLSMEVLEQKAYFAAVGNVGGMYVCNLSSLESEVLLKNNSESCVEIKGLCKFETGIAFTDLGDRKVKLFCPTEKTVKTLLGSGQEGTSDGTEGTCSFTQVHGISSLENTLLVSDVAAGTIKLVSGLSGTASFLQALGSLYDSFGIRAQSTEKTQMSLQDAVNKVTHVNDNIKKTVSEVKQRHSLKETTATNGPEGTVTNKTQVSLKLLEQGMRRLHDSITSISKDYLEDVELCTLLTAVVENLHAVSHFKHETFTALEYSQDFGTITKESLKRVTKWGAKYFTYDKSYYPVPQTSMEFANVNFMQPLPSKVISPEIETAMKELVEKYRPVRQRTVRGETTKDKAGALPPAVYTQQHNFNKEDLTAGLGNDPNTEDPVEEEGEFVQATSEGGDVTEVTFVDDSLVAVAVAKPQPPQDEYETDSEDDFSDTEGEDFAPIAVSRSGRPIRAHFRLDL